MATPVEGLDEPAHTGELVRRLREAAGLSVEQVAVRAGITPQRLRALEAGEGVRDLGYAEVCALVRATQPPRPAWWSDGFEHDLTVTRLGPPATAEGRRYWNRVAEVRQQLEDSAAPDPPDPDGQLRLLCQALNEAGVAYVVFGRASAGWRCMWVASTTSSCRSGSCAAPRTSISSRHWST